VVIERPSKNARITIYSARPGVVIGKKGEDIEGLRNALQKLMGVPVHRVIALTFFVGGAMGGLAGVLFGLHYSLVNPYSGFFPGLRAFTAAVLGGIGNIPGAMLGGLLLSMLEALAASYLSLFTDGAFGAEYKDVFAFVVLILILMFRPKGLLGEKVREERA
jgi:branched-chain amino acid transport system permease protein